MTDVHVSIGNSDDKLTQHQWAMFTTMFENEIRQHADRIYGVWHSLPNSPWQNMCIAFGCDVDRRQQLMPELRLLASIYGQDSVAWLEGSTTFIETVEEA